MSYVHMEVEHLTHRDHKQGIKEVTHDKNKKYFTIISTYKHLLSCYKHDRQLTMQTRYS